MLVTLDTTLQTPLYLQIRDQLRERILRGGLRPGERLDPSRELAKRLGVHRTTIANAYAELEAEGLIAGTVGRGTFVTPLAETLKSIPQARERTRPAAHDRFWDGYFAEEQRDDSLGRLMASTMEAGVISFAAAHGASEISPLELVRRATDAVFRRDGGQVLQYGSSDGYLPLKHYLQAYLRRDGIAVELDELLITNGCQQSLDLIRRSLVTPGDAVVCENPTYPGLWNVFEGPGVRLIGVPVMEEGIDLDFLAAVLEQTRVKLILVSPNFQNPTGRTMPLAMRKRLLELAGRFQVPLVEDDIYGALRYQGRQLPPLKALDVGGLVMHLNSFSKVGFPGLRVGWIVASRRVVDRLRWAKQRADLHTNMLGQAVLEELGRRGLLDKWVRRTCKVYERKLGVLRRAAERHFPQGIRVVYPEGGMSVWVELPPELDAGDLLVKSQERRVIFAPARYFYFQNARHNALRLCFTGPPDEQIVQGIAILGELLKGEMGKVTKERKRSRAGAGVALV
jgi:2-aminoadipate transaminase